MRCAVAVSHQRTLAGAAETGPLGVQAVIIGYLHASPKDESIDVEANHHLGVAAQAMPACLAPTDLRRTETFSVEQQIGDRG